MKNLIFAVLFVLTIVNATHASNEKEPVRMVVTAAFVSQNGLPVYEKLAKYLGKKMGREVSVISGTSYNESDKLLAQGIIQVGFICGLPYTQNHASGKVDLVAIPVMAMKKGEIKGTPGYEKVPGKYYSYTIVRKDSRIRNWKDLTFNEKTSNSGYNMPRYKLVQLGAKSWEDYFSRIVVSGSHEESIRLVSKGIVDASSVDSLVLDYDRHMGNADALNVKIIEVLFPNGAGIPPVVLSSKADPALRKILTHILTNMHKDPEGRTILKEALMLRFDPPNDSNYDDIRRMEKAAHVFSTIPDNKI